MRKLVGVSTLALAMALLPAPAGAATVNVPATITFTVPNSSGAQVTGTPNPFVVSFSDAMTAFDHYILITVKSNSTLPAGTTVSWAPTASVNGDASAELLVPVYSLVYQGWNGYSSGSVNLTWTISTTLPAGTYQIGLTWGFEDLLYEGDGV